MVDVAERVARHGSDLEVALWHETADYLVLREQLLREAVAAVYPERSGEDAMEVFPAPTQPRDAAPDPKLDARQVAELRRGAGRFGIGGELDVQSGADIQLLEGGKPWKVLAERKIAAGRRVYAGSDHRLIGDDEVGFMREQIRIARGLEHVEEVPLEDVAKTEYGMVRQLAELEAGFTPLEQDEVLPFGYDIHNKFALVREPTGQLVRIGIDAEGKDVFILRVDQENYEDRGQQKYRNRPDATDLMRFLSRMLDEQGDTTSSVGFNTSSTYASRVVSMMRAGLQNGRRFLVGMYGRQTLADAKGDSATSPTALNQIPGEVYVVAEQLKLLREELWKRRGALQSGIERLYDFDPVGSDEEAAKRQVVAIVAIVALQGSGLVRPGMERQEADSEDDGMIGNFAVRAILRDFRKLGRGASLVA